MKFTWDYVMDKECQYHYNKVSFLYIVFINVLNFIQ